MAQGTVFPALAALAPGAPGDAHRPAGRLYAASTWGSVLGVLIAGFAALPLLGTRRSLLLASSASMAMAVLPLTLLPLRRRSLALGGLGSVLLALGLSFILPGWDRDVM